MAKRKSTSKNRKPNDYPQAPKSSDFEHIDMGIDKTPSEGPNLVPYVVIALVVFIAFSLFVIKQGSSDAPNQSPNESVPYLYELDITVAEVNGDSEISYDGVEWQPLTTTSRVASRSYVRTAADSEVRLTLDEGLTYITLNENSQLLVSNLSSVAPTLEPMQGAIHYQLSLVGNRTYAIDLVAETLKAETAEFISYTNAGVTEVFVIGGGLWTNKDVRVEAGQVFTPPKNVSEKQLPPFLKQFADRVVD